MTVVDGVAVRARPRSARRDLVTDPVTGQPGIRVQLHLGPGDLVREDVAGEGYTDVYLVGDVHERPRTRGCRPGCRPDGSGSASWALGTGRSGSVAAPSPRSPCTSTDDLAEAILRPPGWQTDVVLDAETQIVADVDLSQVSDGHGLLGLVVEPTPLSDDDAIAAAVAQAAQSDVAVVVVGLTEEEETEAFDKTTLALPGRQDSS